MDHDYQVYAADPAWVLAPVEPTQEMCEAATKLPVDTGQGEYTILSLEEAAATYGAMLAAAPPPPAGSDGWREAALRAFATPLERLAGFERDGMPEGMGPLTNEDGICVQVGELRALRAALSATPPVAPRG